MSRGPRLDLRKEGSIAAMVVDNLNHANRPCTKRELAEEMAMFLDYPRYPETRVATILRRTREPGYEGRPIAWVQAKGRYETISTNSNLLADHQRGTMNPVRRGLEGATSGILLVASEKCPELVPELTRIEDAYRREIRELRADNDALLLTLRVVHRDPQGQKVLSAALDRACEEFSDELPALPPGPSAPYGDGAVG